MQRRPSIAEKGLSIKTYKKDIPLAPSLKAKSTNTSGSVFAERIEPIKKTKNYLGLVKIVACFLHCYSSRSGNLVTFKYKSFWDYQFRQSKGFKNVKW